MQKNLFFKKKTNCLELYFSFKYFFLNQFFYNLYLVRRIKSFSYLFFGHNAIYKLLLFVLKRNNRMNSKSPKKLKIKMRVASFNFFKPLKKKTRFFFVSFKPITFCNSSLKKDNKNRTANLFSAEISGQIKKIAYLTEFFNPVELKNLKTVIFCLNKITVQFPLCGHYENGFKFKEIFNNLFIINTTDKISQNNFNSNFNFYPANLQKLHIKFFTQDLLHPQKKKLSYATYFIKNKKKSTLILYFKNLTKIKQYFFLYRKHFFWPEISAEKRFAIQSHKKAHTYLKTLVNLNKIKDFFFKFFFIRFKYLAIKSKYRFFKSYFFSIPSIPFLNVQIYRFIYFLRIFHDIQHFLSSASLIKKNEKKLKIDSYFFFCYFILKTKKTKLFIHYNKAKIVQRSNHFRNSTKKSGYLVTQQIYKTKDFQNLDFYSRFYNNKKRTKKFYSLIKKIFVERSYGLLLKKQLFIFSFKFLDNLLLVFLFNWAKNQHKNNKNFWIFTNYWLFIQPFPYFYSNQAYFNFCVANISEIPGQKNQGIYLIDKQTLLNYNLIKKLGSTVCAKLISTLISKHKKNTKIQYNIFLSPKIKKRINNKIEQNSQIIDKIEIVNIQFKKVFSFLLFACTADLFSQRSLRDGKSPKNKFQLLITTQYFINKKSKNLVAGFVTCRHVRPQQKKQQQQQIKIKNQRLKKNLKTYYLDKYKIFFFPVKRNLSREKTTYAIKKKKLKEFTFGTKFTLFKKIFLDNFKTINLGLYFKNEDFSAAFKKI